ncbi:MAG: hypothetical protein AB1625_03315, partial [Acidobacteriota bacterium]
MRACTRVEQIVAAGVGALALAAAASAAEPAAISLERRVAAQRAIEEVYWRHREWPEQNPGPKPALSAVLGERVIRERAEDGVRASVKSGVRLALLRFRDGAPSARSGHGSRTTRGVASGCCVSSPTARTTWPATCA